MVPWILSEETADDGSFLGDGEAAAGETFLRGETVELGSFLGDGETADGESFLDSLSWILSRRWRSRTYCD